MSLVHPNGQSPCPASSSPYCRALPYKMLPVPSSPDCHATCTWATAGDADLDGSIAAGQVLIAAI